MDKHKDVYFKRNVCAVTLVEFLWGFGFPIVLESTFLQLFLKSLGASSFAIGMVPALLIGSISFFPLFSSYFSRNYRYKRMLVLYLHLATALTILLFGLIVLTVGNADNILILFFLCYGGFSICLGLTIPVWLNYNIRIFSEAKLVPSLGYMMLFQNIAKIISSFFILKFVEKYAFSIGSSAWVFIITGLVFCIASIPFALTKELADPNDPDPDDTSFLQHTRESLTEILNNRRFLHYLIADLDFFVVLTTLGFYANYATGYFGIDPAIAAGFFVACIYAGSVTVNVLLGTMDLLSLKQKFVLSKAVSVTLLLLLVFFPAAPTFFVISFMLGVVRGTRNMVYAPSVRKFTSRTDTTPYFSIAPVLTLPFAAGFPLLFGKMLDNLAYLEADSYRLLFGVSMLLSLAAFFLSLKIDFRAEGRESSA